MLHVKLREIKVWFTINSECSLTFSYHFTCNVFSYFVFTLRASANVTMGYNKTCFFKLRKLRFLDKIELLFNAYRII